MTTYTITESEYDQLIKLANKIICAGNGNLPGNSVGNDLGRDVIAMLRNLQPNTQEPVGWLIDGLDVVMSYARAKAEQAEHHAMGGTEVAYPIYTHPAPKDSNEPRLSDLFCGVDVTEGMLYVSVLRRRSDDVAEVLHSEQLELPQAKPLTDEQILQGYHASGGRFKDGVKFAEQRHNIGVKP